MSIHYNLDDKEFISCLLETKNKYFYISETHRDDNHAHINIQPKRLKKLIREARQMDNEIKAKVLIFVVLELIAIHREHIKRVWKHDLKRKMHRK